MSFFPPHTCGNPLKEHTSWKKENPGRRFMQCSLYMEDGGCDYKMWVDPEIPPRYVEVINGMRKTQVMLVYQTTKLKAKLLVAERKLAAANGQGSSSHDGTVEDA